MSVSANSGTIDENGSTRRGRGHRGNAVGLDESTDSGGKRKRPRKPAQGRPPRSKGKRKGQGQKVDMDTFYHMMHAYHERQTIGYVAKVCGVSEATARKYVCKGDPSRGLPAIHDEWTSSQRIAIKEEGLTLAKARRKGLKLVSELMDKYAQAISDLDPVNLSPHTIGIGLDRLIKMQEHLLQPVASDSQDSEDPYKDWTDDEILEYMTTGVMPEFARLPILRPTK